VIAIGGDSSLVVGLAFYGVPVSNSVMLAVSNTTHLGLNVGGVTYALVLVAFNDDCTPTKAISVANERIGQGVSTMVGHIRSSISNAAQPFMPRRECRWLARVPPRRE
jgi:ABC-type branched-subunit amino acid transport system substrate-binding protein